MIVVTWGAVTDTGRTRSLNQDSVLAEAPVFLVADGMGGHLGGEVASGMTVDLFRECLERPALIASEIADLLQHANAEIRRRSRDDAQVSDMGTTAVGLAMVKEADGDYWLAFNIGDSRIYRLFDGVLTQLTVDHSLVQDMVASGRIAPEEARTHPDRNIVTRVLGVQDHPVPDFWVFPPEPGERFLICSDGLSGELDDFAIGFLLSQAEPPDEIARRLVAEANQCGGRDNITVIVVDVAEVDDDAPERPVETTAQFGAVSAVPSTGSFRVGGPATPQAPVAVPGSSGTVTDDYLAAGYRYDGLPGGEPVRASDGYPDAPDPYPRQEPAPYGGDPYAVPSRRDTGPYGDVPGGPAASAGYVPAPGEYGGAGGYPEATGRNPNGAAQYQEGVGQYQESAGQYRDGVAGTAGDGYRDDYGHGRDAGYRGAASSGSAGPGLGTSPGGYLPGHDGPTTPGGGRYPGATYGRYAADDGPDAGAGRVPAAGGGGYPESVGGGTAPTLGFAADDPTGYSGYGDGYGGAGPGNRDGTGADGRYDAGPRYRDDAGYGADAGYGQDRGYDGDARYQGEVLGGADGRYGGDAGYGAESGDAGYGVDAGYGQDGRYGGDAGYGADGGDVGYGQDGRYGADAGYGQDGRYGGDAGYGADGTDAGYGQDGRYDGDAADPYGGYPGGGGRPGEDGADGSEDGEQGGRGLSGLWSRRRRNRDGRH